MSRTVTSSKSSRLPATEPIRIMDPEERRESKSSSSAKQLWRVSTPAALRRVLRKRGVQVSDISSESEGEEVTESSNAQEVEKRTRVLPDMQNQEESAELSPSVSVCRAGRIWSRNE